MGLSLGRDRDVDPPRVPEQPLPPPTDLPRAPPAHLPGLPLPLSSAVVMQDCWSASDVAGNGCQVRGNMETSFTQFSSQTFTHNDNIDVSCKIYVRKGKLAGFGLVPYDAIDGMREHLVGEKEIPGSVGCLLTDNRVCLCRNDAIFFNGDHSTSDPTLIRMRYRAGRLSFEVDGMGVSSDELDGMRFEGRFRVGLGMSAKGQYAEVYPTSEFRMHEGLGTTLGDICSGNGTTFTQCSEQVFDPAQRHAVTLRIIDRRDKSIVFGVVPEHNLDGCSRAVPGSKSIPQSVGLHIVNDGVGLVRNSDVFYKRRACPASFITMIIDKGQLEFSIDGERIVSSRMQELTLRSRCRVAIGFTDTQHVELRGGVFLPGDHTTIARLRLPGTMTHEECVRRRRTEDSRSGQTGQTESVFTWMDNMGSVNCDKGDAVAVCVRNFCSTLYTKQAVSASAPRPVSLTLRILRQSAPVAPLIVGVLAENTEGHAVNLLGHRELADSVGLWQDGSVTVEGRIVSQGKGFTTGDLVELTIHEATLSVKVNGEDALGGTAQLWQGANYRFGCSLTHVGQAVKIGAGELDSEELSHCGKNDVLPITTPASRKRRRDIDDCSGPESDSLAPEYFEIPSGRVAYDTTLPGPSSRVYCGVYEGVRVAVREMEWDDNPRLRRSVLAPASLSRHPNVATVLGWARAGDRLIVLTHLYPSSLAVLLKSVSPGALPAPYTGGPLGFAFFFNTCKGILRALRLMAERRPRPLVHGGLGPGKILLDAQNCPAIAGFGPTEPTESPTPALDVLGFCCIAYEILYAPRRVVRGADGLPLMDGIPEPLASVLVPGFSPDPEARPSAETLLNKLEALETILMS
eukprot:Hpha_TRINITY_DN3759_c0_g2::TRINITY_DN3759_c0_g2_i1::g.23800::m.23800